MEMKIIDEQLEDKQQIVSFQSYIICVLKYFYLIQLEGIKYFKLNLLASMKVLKFFQIN